MAMAEVPPVGRRELKLDPQDIAGRQRRELHPGVTYSILWRDGTNAAGVMRVEAGAEVPEHTHESSSHHVWITEGHARVGDRTLPAGSYVHVPAGTAHRLEGLKPQGFTMMYLFIDD